MASTQAMTVRVKTIRHARRHAKRTVLCVVPAMVRTSQGARIAGVFQQHPAAAVAANIEHCVDGPAFRPNQDQVVTGDIQKEVVTGLGNLCDMACHQFIDPGTAGVHLGKRFQSRRISRAAL